MCPSSSDDFGIADKGLNPRTTDSSPRKLFTFAGGTCSTAKDAADHTQILRVKASEFTVLLVCEPALGREMDARWTRDSHQIAQGLDDPVLSSTNSCISSSNEGFSRGTIEETPGVPIWNKITSFTFSGTWDISVITAASAVRIKFGSQNLRRISDTSAGMTVSLVSERLKLRRLAHHTHPVEEANFVWAHMGASTNAARQDPRPQSRQKVVPRYART